MIMKESKNGRIWFGINVVVVDAIVWTKFVNLISKGIVNIYTIINI